MKPGKELDLLIAEKVMGIDKNLKDLLPYSTNITAAWDVINKLKEKSLHFIISTAPSWDDLVDGEVLVKRERAHPVRQDPLQSKHITIQNKLKLNFSFSLLLKIIH